MPICISSSNACAINQAIHPHFDQKANAVIERVISSGELALWARIPAECSPKIYHVIYEQGGYLCWFRKPGDKAVPGEVKYTAAPAYVPWYMQPYNNVKLAASELSFEAACRKEGFKSCTDSGDD